MILNNVQENEENLCLRLVLAKKAIKFRRRRQGAECNALQFVHRVGDGSRMSCLGHSLVLRTRIILLLSRRRRRRHRRQDQHSVRRTIYSQCFFFILQEDVSNPMIFKCLCLKIPLPRDCQSASTRNPPPMRSAFLPYRIHACTIPVRSFALVLP
jgi:hypothetical protein